MSAKDTDYMHIVNWKAAEKLFKAGKFRKVNGHALIPMEEMVEANALFLLPEPTKPSWRGHQSRRSLCDRFR